MRPYLSLGESDELVFRLYGIVHLVVDQIIFDLRLVAGAIDSDLRGEVGKVTNK